MRKERGALRGGTAGIKSVLSTKVKYLGLGRGPGFGVGKFIVIFCFGETALSLCCGVWSGQGGEAWWLMGYEAEVFTKEHFDSLY